MDNQLKESLADKTNKGSPLFKSTTKENKKSMMLSKIKEQPQDFRVGDLTGDDTKLRQTANIMLGQLRKHGDLSCKRSRQDAVWTKTDEFGKSPLWEPKPAKLSRKMLAVKISVVLETLKAIPKDFAIKDLHTSDNGVNINTARELVRLLSKEGELRPDGGRPNAEWTKTDKFGRSELWALLDSPGQAKFYSIREKIENSEESVKKSGIKETKTSILLKRIKALPATFLMSDVSKNDSAMARLANSIAGRLSKVGELECHKGLATAYWSKTAAFGQSDIWSSVQPESIENTGKG